VPIVLFTTMCKRSILDAGSSADDSIAWACVTD
jgi:hypothetical protein